MKASIFSYTRNGAKISIILRGCLEEMGYCTTAYTTKKYLKEDSSLVLSPGFVKGTEQAFQEDRVVIYIGSCGIAVRAIAKFIKSKISDPAIISIDEQGKYVIPLLSGHIGGANGIARKLANILDAQAIITTATDINGLFAVDEWAVKNNLYIGSMFAAKEFASALVDSEKTGIMSTYEIMDELPKGVEAIENARVGIVVGDDINFKPYPVTLNLLPQVYYLGIGCRRDTPLAKIEALVLPKLQELKINIKAIRAIASVDLKKDELGLLAFGEKYKLPLQFFSALELEKVAGEFTPSSFVQSIVGVNNVCERSAVKASNDGQLVLNKISLDGVTLAIAKKNWQVSFKY